MTTTIPTPQLRPHTPTCLTCRTPKKAKRQALSQNQVQITAATGLLNTGVPLHVLQRYLGHLTPTMSMTYAQTLQSTAEAEFLRYRKITADGREIEVDPRDLYDMLELDRRTDRILPNGYCLLPPRQICGKGKPA